MPVTDSLHIPCLPNIGTLRHWTHTPSCLIFKDVSPEGRQAQSSESKCCTLVITVFHFPWPLLLFITVVCFFFCFKSHFYRSVGQNRSLSATPVPFTMIRCGMLGLRRGPDALGWKWSKGWSVVFNCYWNLRSNIRCVFLSLACPGSQYIGSVFPHMRLSIPIEPRVCHKFPKRLLVAWEWEDSGVEIKTHNVGIFYQQRLAKPSLLNLVIMPELFLQ